MTRVAAATPSLSLAGGWWHMTPAALFLGLLRWGRRKITFNLGSWAGGGRSVSCTTEIGPLAHSRLHARFLCKENRKH